MKKLALLFVVPLFACGIITWPPKPVPTPTPTPTPVTCPEQCGHGTKCTDPAKGCEPIPAPGEVCNPGETCGCFVFPPDEPDWRALTCAEREGYTVDCVENMCAYTKIPEPKPEGCIDEKFLEPTTCSGPQFSKVVKAATDKLGPNPDGSPKANLEKLADAIRAEGYCTLAGSEALFLLREDGLVEENHAVFWGDGSWTNSGSGKFIGCHKRSENTPADMCPEPLPNLDPSHLKINVKPYGRWIDSTIVTVNTCDYCLKIGSGDPGPDGKPTRCGCPMRLDGDPYRVPCELYAAGGGDPTWQTDPPDKEIVLHNGNPWQVACVGCQRLRVCTIDLSVCSKWIDAP